MHTDSRASPIVFLHAANPLTGHDDEPTERRLEEDEKRRANDVAVATRRYLQEKVLAISSCAGVHSAGKNVEKS